MNSEEIEFLSMNNAVLHNQVGHITKQRDELLAALERFTLYPGCTCDRDYEIANAAIASVKGGAA